MRMGAMTYKGYRIRRSENRSRGRDNGLTSRCPYSYSVYAPNGQYVGYADTMAQAKAVVNSHKSGS